MRLPVVAVVLLALFGDYVLLTVIVPIVPDLFSEATKLAVGFLFSSKALVQILASPFVGHLSDSVIGPQRCLALGLLVLAISTGIWAFSTLYYVLLVARAVQGLASSLTMAGGLALVAKTHSASERGAASGVVMSGVAAGVLAGPTIGGVLFGNFGQAVTFLSIAGLLAVDLIAQLILWHATGDHISDSDDNDLLVPLHDDDDESLAIQSRTSTDAEAEAEAQNRTSEKDGSDATRSATATFFALVCDPYVQILLASIVVANAIISMLEPLVPAILKEDFGLNTETRSIMWSVAPLGYLLATPVAGFLSDRVARCKIVAAALLIFGISLPFGAQFGPQQPLLLAATAIAGVATAFVDTPVIPLLADVVEWRKIDGFGTTFAIADSATSLGFVIGPLLGEALAGLIAPQWTFVVFGIAALVLSPIPLFLAKVPVSG